MGGSNSVRHEQVTRPQIDQRPTLQVIDGLHSSIEYAQLTNYIDAQAAKFWGVSQDHTIFDPRTDDEFYLDKLSFALKKLPDPITDETIRTAWRSKKFNSAFKLSGLITRKVTYPKYVDTRCLGAEETITYAHLIDHPIINLRTFSYLDERGDPALLVVKGFEQWRQKHVASVDKSEALPIPDVAFERGVRVMEQFLFLVGGVKALVDEVQLAIQRGDSTDLHAVERACKPGNALPYLLRKFSIEYIREETSTHQP